MTVFSQVGILIVIVKIIFCQFDNFTFTQWWWQTTLVGTSDLGQAHRNVAATRANSLSDHHIHPHCYASESIYIFTKNPIIRLFK